MGGETEDPNKAAMEMQKDQMKRLDALELPELEEYILQNPELVGLLEAEQLDPSAMEEIHTDPRLKEQQMAALASMSERAEGGLTDEDKFAMEQMLGQVGAQERSQRASIEQEMARKGTSDSGASLMAKLHGAQGGANSARQQAMQMAAQGQNQKLAALQNVGQMAGQMEGADYQRQAQAAGARDAIAKANAMNRQNVNAGNLAARQNIENQRAAIANQQSQVGNEIAQQNFNNAYAKTGAQGQVTNSMSNIAGNAAQKPSGAQAAMGGAASMGAATGGNPYAMAGGAAMGYLSTMEDGGIAKAQAAETKQHERFKSNYMKRVREELAPQKKAREEVTGLQNGGIAPESKSQYTFDAPTFDPVSVMDPVQVDLEKPEITQDPVERDVIQEAADNTQLAPKKELIEKESKFDGDKMSKGLGALSKMLGDGKSKRKTLELGSYSQPEIKNTLSQIKAQQFGNPMSKFGSALEDGGVPYYEDMYSGTKQAEDGNLMFDSEGEGAVVGGDSFERDRVDARLNSGEMVLNGAQQQRLMDILRGEESVDNVGEDDIVEGVPESYQQELIEEKTEGGDSDKVEGLKRLLSALGEE